MAGLWGGGGEGTSPHLCLLQRRDPSPRTMRKDLSGEFPESKRGAKAAADTPRWAGGEETCFLTAIL